MANTKILPDITYSLWTTILLKRPLYEDLIKDSPGRVVSSSREQGRRIKFVFLFVCFLRFVLNFKDDGDDDERAVSSLREQSRRHQVFLGLR